MKKRKNSVGYFSAYYRGLECLLKMWPAIRKRVPDATLDVYYGWESWVALQGEDDFYERMERRFAELADQGVTVHGRVSHEELAKAMSEIQVWAYPTKFQEIHCITALKAQEAGCYPVVTNVAALDETVQCGTKIKTKRIYTDEYKQEKFVEAVVEALDKEMVGKPVPGVDWADVALDWDQVIKEIENERTKSETEKKDGDSKTETAVQAASSSSADRQDEQGRATRVENDVHTEKGASQDNSQVPDRSTQGED